MEKFSYAVRAIPEFSILDLFQELEPKMFKSVKTELCDSGSGNKTYFVKINYVENHTGEESGARFVTK